MSYNPNVTSGIDQLRLTVQDNVEPYILSDGEILYILNLYNGDINRSGEHACGLLAAHFARKADIEIDEAYKVSYRDMQSRYLELRKTIGTQPVRKASSNPILFTSRGNEEVGRISKGLGNRFSNYTLRGDS